ncbi:MAG: preprotein translocase subunit SecE [Candidatus Omnitrophica bacterium]|nr:preprotein translocase subunit SecE [Candidatus Omnitrophota bacterium]
MANKVAGFFKEVKLEMIKVSWPNKNELVGSTIVVLVSLGVLALFIGVCDIALSTLVNVIMTRL